MKTPDPHKTFSDTFSDGKGQRYLVTTYRREFSLILSDDKSPALHKNFSDLIPAGRRRGTLSQPVKGGAFADRG